jgi:uncharacterized membrane protein YhaH (DUF805 family)
MFSNLFSSVGRIRRLEYGLSVALYIMAAVILDKALGKSNSGLMGFLYIPLIWCLFAQGAKRCHDINNSGWCQIIPFYFLWMVFKEGTWGINNYGYDPKAGINNQHLAVKPVDTIIYPKPQPQYTNPIANVVHNLQKQNPVPLNQQTLLEVTNVNYGLTQDVLKKLRLLDKTNSLLYTLSGTTAAITISHSNTTQSLLDDLYQIMPNIEVREVKPGSISIKIK